ncbi:hypothetical protein [Pseudolactococcus insecticola]|uniref:Uncharacterized protein n=1 Tax=Pseudolactococcus insecticola TaxID=2709158 RepID=A0A6A0B456_9LACT|nr:hypothetical protein [Lactococcus insecticola]GFH39826.1 hypothetical protein Hs20B_02240 [Lactococcus insecticola]
MNEEAYQREMSEIEDFEKEDEKKRDYIDEHHRDTVNAIKEEIKSLIFINYFDEAREKIDDLGAFLNSASYDYDEAIEIIKKYQ